MTTGRCLAGPDASGRRGEVRLRRGIPVGLQLVAAPDREDLLVAVGREVEESPGPAEVEHNPRINRMRA